VNTIEIIKHYQLPENVKWTKDNGAAHVYDTREEAKAFQGVIDEALGHGHAATTTTRCAFFGEPECGWTVALDFHGGTSGGYCTLFPAESFTVAQANHERLSEEDIDAICAEYDDEEITRRRRLYKRLDALCEHIEDLEHNAHAVRIELEDIEKGIIATANEELWEI
jgi:hypothetical protein